MSAQYTVLYLPLDAGVDTGPDGAVEDAGVDSTVKEDTGGPDQQAQTDQQVQVDQIVQTDQLVPQQDRGLPPDQGAPQFDFGGGQLDTGGQLLDGASGGDGVTPPGEEGCDCSVEGGSLAGRAPLALLLLGWLLLRRRRRRRRD